MKEFLHNLNHVAIIMDGNGRWAKKRNRPRVWGHIRGASVVSSIVEEAQNLGIGKLTLYAFSTENWSRPAAEVKTLFLLLRKFIRQERERIKKNNILFRVMGDIQGLSQETKNLIKSLEEETAVNTGLKLTFAFGYGSRQEILHSVNKFITANPEKKMAPEDLEKNLYLPDLGDVDLLIRTGGDYRISNFLLWQLAYAELYFTETKWPDFTPDELAHIVNVVTPRERRFGSLERTPDMVQTVYLAKQNKEMLAFSND